MLVLSQEKHEITQMNLLWPGRIPLRKKKKKAPKYHSKLEFISKHQKEFYIFKSSTLKSISQTQTNSDCNCSDSSYVDATNSAVSAFCPRIQSYTALDCPAGKMYLAV